MEEKQGGYPRCEGAVQMLWSVWVKDRGETSMGRTEMSFLQTISQWKTVKVVSSQNTRSQPVLLRRDFKLVNSTGRAKQWDVTDPEDVWSVLRKRCPDRGGGLGCDSLLKVLRTSKEELDRDRTNSDNTDSHEYKVVEPVILTGAQIFKR